MKTRQASALDNETSKRKTKFSPLRRSKKAPESAETAGYQDALAQPAVERQLADDGRIAKKPLHRAERDVRSETEPSSQAERRKKRKSQETDEQPEPGGAAGFPASKSRRKGSKASSEGKSPPLIAGGDAASRQPAETSRLAAKKLGSTARMPAAIGDAAQQSDDDNDDDAPEEVTALCHLESLPVACHVPSPSSYVPPAVGLAPLNSSVTT